MKQMLSHLRVLDIGEMAAAPCASKVLGDLGAQVIKVEPPEGDPARGYGPVGPPLHDPRFESLAGRKQHESELEAALASFTAQFSAWELAERLQAAGVAAYPSLSCPELESNPQLIAREFWERFDHPEVGMRTHSAVAWKTRNAANGFMFRAPLLGEPTAEILGGL